MTQKRICKKTFAAKFDFWKSGGGGGGGGGGRGTISPLYPTPPLFIRGPVTIIYCLRLGFMQSLASFFSILSGDLYLDVLIIGLF